ncbi:hypothetical protein [Halorubrum salinum]|uniref:hypothetical protein n=1 Tax=Halorubrum salinum TaxID=767517 RepID=UPI0021118242|nr:hypothetical protein [Halorubrum salinum]
MVMSEIWGFVTNLVSPRNRHNIFLIIYLTALFTLAQTNTISQDAVMELTAWTMWAVFLAGPVQTLAEGGSKNKSETESAGDSESESADDSESESQDEKREKPNDILD